MKLGEIRVGTASWADPGFVERWYPRGLPASERLKWYAEHFNLVELNSSFYAIPSQKVVERWCQQTPPRFLFDLKLHRLLSRHSTGPDLLPPDLREAAPIQKGKVALTPALERKVAKRFLREIRPLAETGKLGALLLQLSPAFRPKTHMLEELDNLFACFSGHRLAVELRNLDWMAGDQLAATLAFFRKRRISFVSVDAPLAGHFMVMPSEDYVTNDALAYLRCHGRNAEGYIRGRSVAERFDYKYRKDELEELAERTLELAAQSAEVHVVYNNNSANYAPVNAGQFKSIIEHKQPNVSTGPKIPATESSPHLEIPELNLGKVWPRKRVHHEINK